MKKYIKNINQRDTSILFKKTWPEKLRDVAKIGMLMLILLFLLGFISDNLLSDSVSNRRRNNLLEKIKTQL